MAALTLQDLLWTQDNSQTAQIDAGLAAQSVPRRVADFQGYSFNVFWAGSPKGTLDVQLCNASILQDQLVGPGQWVTIPSLSLSIGQGSSPATSPALVEVTFGRAGWAALLWTPAGGSGAISVKFDGVRR